MALYLYPVPAVVYVQQIEAERTPSSLSRQDPRLQAEIPATELISGNFKHLTKWTFSASKVYIGTTPIF